MLESLVVNILNQFLKDYVSNLNYDQLKIGIWNGEVNLSNLKLRKDALDKLDLPISVSEGYIGDVTLVIPWSNLKGQPVKAIINDIYLLAEPKNDKTFSAKEEEEKLFRLKQQRLAQAEVLDSPQEESKASDGFIGQLTTKIINNLQFQVKNIHIRYEDNISDPGHPFAVGVTLKELCGQSTDDEWQPRFISDPASPVNKLVTLESLSVYWDTDSKSLAGQYEQDANVFANLISTRADNSKSHQFLLKPVSGTAQVTLNKATDKPQTQATLSFDEIAFGLDENQYRDCILMLDLFQANIKKQHYIKFRPTSDKTVKKNPREFFQFAAQAVLSEIHDKNYKWTWDHFRTRRDQRLSYVECYMANQLNSATDEQSKTLDELEHVLSFQDIRFYRSIAKVNLRKQKVQIEIETQRKKAEDAKKSWWSWATGASSESNSDEEPIQMTEEQKKELYEAIEYDEDKINISAKSSLPKDGIALSVNTKLNRGSFTLNTKGKELFSLVFDKVSAEMTQYVESLKVSAALGDFQLFDGNQETIYSQLVGVKKDLSLLDTRSNRDIEQQKTASESSSEPFFFAVFEKDPLNSAANNALQLKIRPLEIIYSPTLVANVTEFFKPPSSKMEGVNAVIAAAGSRLEKLKTHSRASLEFAFEKHTTFDVDIHIDAPILYIPDSLTTGSPSVLMINPGHITVSSELADAKTIEEIKTKGIQNYSAQDAATLDKLMYDKFNVQLTHTKIAIGSVQECMGESKDSVDPCFIDRMDIDFSIELCILPDNTQFAKAKVFGSLPLLNINMSDDKYTTLMKIVEATSPKSDALPDTEETQPTALRTSESQAEIALPSTENESKAEDSLSGVEKFRVSFQIDKISLKLCETTLDNNLRKDQELCEIVLEGFSLGVVGKLMDLSVDMSLQELNVLDKMEHGNEFKYLLASGDFETKDTTTSKKLLSMVYQKTSKDHPEFSTTYEGYDQSVDLSMATLTIVVTRSSILYLQNWATKAFASGPKKQEVQKIQDNSKSYESKEKIRATLRMDSTNIMLNQDGLRLATLGLHSGDLSVVLESKSVDVTGKFGNLTLSDDAAISCCPEVSEKFIVSIVGDELANFSFQMLDPKHSIEHDQAFKLRMGAIKFVASSTLQPIMHFVEEFFEMKSVYDNAKSAAQETAQKQGNSRFHFDVLVHSPLVVLPAANSDTVTAYLGEVRAKNKFSDNMAHIECGLYKINVQSKTSGDEGLPLLNDFDIVLDVENLEKANDQQQALPQSKIRANVSDVLMSLTEKQYKTILQVLENLKKTFTSGKSPVQATESSEKAITDSSEHTVARVEDSTVKLDFALQLSTVGLEIFKEKDDSLSKLNFNAISVNMQTKSDESTTIKAQLQSIQFSDTRKTSESKFREILPYQSPSQPQFEFKLHSYIEEAPVTDMQVDIHNPKIVLSLDYMLLLKDFFMIPLTETQKSATDVNKPIQPPQLPEKKAHQSILKYNMNISQFEVICLASPEIEASESVSVSFDQLKLSQQDVMGFDLIGLNMSLYRMDNKAESTTHVLEPLEISLLVNQMDGMSVNLQVKPVVLRLSYQDAMLITAIVNKGLALKPPSSSSDKPTASPSPSPNPQEKSDTFKESLIASLEGLQIVLIEDLHNLPFIDFYVEPFQVIASDWSKSLEANTDLCLGMKSFNFKNSHWEPFLEPWKFNISTSPDSADKNTRIMLGSKDLIYLNITHSFVESALAISQTLSEIKTLSDSAQVQVKPYEVVNYTGYNVRFWNMSEDNNDSGYSQVHHLENGKSVPWNFRDEKDRGTNVTKNLLGLQIEENNWEAILSIEVDRERELVYRLKPEGSDHLIIDIRLQDHVKKVILRSGLVLQNNSSQSMEIKLVDTGLDPVLLNSQGTYSIPIRLCSHQIAVRPSDQHAWSRPMTWSGIPSVIDCSPLDDSNSSSGVYLFQTRAQSTKTNFPYLNIQFSAPLEVENLLPFDFDIAFADAKNRVSHLLRSGTKTHIHTFSSDTVLRMQVGLKSERYQPSEVVTLKTNPRYNELGEKLVIKDQNGSPITLRMHVSRTNLSTDSLYVGVYAPYLVLNKSGFPIQLRSQQTFRQGKAPVESIPAYEEGQSITPAIFSYADVSTRNRAQLSLDTSKWSEPVSFEAIGNSQGAALLNKADNCVKHVGIKVEEGKGALRLSKLVTLSPRYILKNNMSTGLEICEFGTTETINLNPEEKTAFYETSGSQTRWVCIRRHGSKAWSAPVNIQDIGKMYVRLDGEHSQLVRISVSVKDSTLFSTFSEDEQWPYQIVNDSSVDIELTQVNIDFDNSQLSSSQRKGLSSPSSFTVVPNQSLPYTWDVPVAKEKKLELCVNGKRRAINFEAIGSQVPFRYSKTDSLSMDVIARGSAIILHITNFDASKSLYRSKSSDESFEAVDLKHVINSVYEINLPGLCVSIIDRHSRELALATVKRFELKYTDSSLYESIRLSIEWIQIDNQKFDSTYPILCYPSARPKVSNEKTTHPTLHVALDKVKDKDHGVQYFKIFSFLIQELTLEVDEAFLYALIDFTQFNTASKKEASKDAFLMKFEEPAPEKESALYYFEEFCIQPMRLNLSFAKDDKVDDGKSTQNMLRNSPIGYAFNVLTMTVGNVNDAPLKLNALMVDNLRASSDDLSMRIALHYREQAMYQVHRVLGSIDILGNPVGLFNNLSSGFGELFYEPYQGFIMSDRPQDLGVGVAKGVGGFMKKSVFGVSDSLSKFTGSLGKGLSAATMDKKFQDKRRTNMNRNKPTHAVGGVTQGVGYFGASLASGITGLVTNPMEGASENGAVGFVGGIGKGLVGAFTKPVAGLFDMTSNITAGIRETATSDGKVILRERLPRFIGQDGILVPYSQREALGQLWLKEVDDGHFFKDNYVAHGLLKSEKEAIILTYDRVILMKSERLKLASQIPLEDISSVDSKQDAICLGLKRGNSQTFAFDQDTNGEWFAKKLMNVLSERKEIESR
ncbi:hypothetical protein BY458DRAFT_470198 [Sporodiniella umbellata]|nr:hypothetical protein BY458DRAFT_470198 [Sporodiniella umbellata]